MSPGLYPRLFRELVFPALDVANRTSVARKLKFLECSQWLDRGQLEDLQREKLESILSWTKRESGFYQTYWREAPSNLRATSEYPYLDGLPVVSKSQLREEPGAFPLLGFKGPVLSVKTSGSTGHPMTFYRSREQESWFWALRLRMWKWAGYVPGEPYLTLNLNPRVAWKKKLQDVLFRCAYHGFNANDHDVDAVLADLEGKRIRHLIGYASSLFLLSNAIRERGVEHPEVSTILSTGDTLLPQYRRRIEEVFGTKVFDYYGAGGEGLHIASQCGGSDGYHIHIENSVVEILRNGRPARAGEVGEIVVTQLDNLAMPLIRYATGDIATAAPEGMGACPCGRQLPMLRSVEGRVPDIVLAPDGSALVVHFFTILFEHLPAVAQFQILQSREGEITARIVPGVGYSRAETEDTIKTAVKKATSGSLETQFEYVDGIPLSRSGKPRIVMSELLSAPVAVDGMLSGEVVRAVSN